MLFSVIAWTRARQAFSFALVGLLFCSSASAAGGAAPERPNIPDRPNIIVIVADDLGYSDLGVMGGEISTPNLDKLAGQGVTFTNFHAAPSCSPTRSMLLTGTDSHVAGLGAMAEFLPADLADQPGYEGYLNDRVTTLATMLRDRGYRTYMAGKWHLGHDREHMPDRRGFEKSFVLLQGAAGHFDNTGWSVRDPIAQYREDGEQISLPEKFYSSVAYTDKLVSYIQSDKASGKPFFAYLAYTAPHWPLQAPDEYLAKYQGRYDDGYQPVYRQRMARMKQLGLVSENLSATREADFAEAWDSLSPEGRMREARRMEIYAAMVEAMDDEIGRLVAFLDDTGTLDNTVILFMSDNGPDGFDAGSIMSQASWIRDNFDNSLENMGRPGSFVSLGPRWAHVSAAPFSMFKAFTYEGGIRVPLIVWSGQGMTASGYNGQYLSVLDLMPTILHLADVVPALGKGGKGGQKVQAFMGNSFHSMLDGDEGLARQAGYYVGLELHGRRSLTQWPWKLVWTVRDPRHPDRAPGWELYDLSKDPAEEDDLSARMPDQLQRMIGLWEDYADKTKVQDFDWGNFAP